MAFLDFIAAGGIVFHKHTLMILNVITILYHHIKLKPEFYIIRPYYCLVMFYPLQPDVCTIQETTDKRDNGSHYTDCCSAAQCIHDALVFGVNCKFICVRVLYHVGGIL